MRKYHPLTVSGLRNETPDSLRVSLTVPDEAVDDFRFLPGQHLPVQVTVDGKPVRRTYSICSAPGELPLEIGVRIQPGGKFSEFVAGSLKVNDELQVMPPFGQFHADIDPKHAGTYLAFAAGSGITPILSIMRATLGQEPESRFLLFYGNRRQQSTMFIDDLYALKNQYPERVQLFFLFSQEEQEFEVFDGRLDEDKVAELYESFCSGLKPDEAYVCGPGTMIESVRNSLLALGMNAENIHIERFGAPRRHVTARLGASDTAKSQDEKRATVHVIMDGHQKSFEMPFDGTNIVDAAAERGIDLPYSCKGGVCATCRTHVREGKVRMETNYGLEPWEVDEGFVLACQSVPLGEKITLDYDKT